MLQIAYDNYPNFVAAEWLLGYLRNAGIRAVICGGYVRDTLLQRPVRDIDLYIANEDYIKAMSILTYSNDIPESSQKTEEYQHQSIERQAEFKLGFNLVEEFGLPTDIVNIIGIKSIFLSAEIVTERYNLGICMAGISLSGTALKVHRDPRFDLDVKNCTITVYRTDWGQEATTRQIVKLNAEKYKYWRVKYAAPDALTLDEIFSI